MGRSRAMAVALFSRGVQPSEVMRMRYPQLKVWFEILKDLVELERQEQ